MPETISPPKIEKEKVEEQREENHQMMKKILDMFGTEKARNIFLEALEQYHEKYRDQKFSSISGQLESEKGRAALHNQIMETFQRLSLIAELNSEEEEILRQLADRETTHQVIEDYLSVEQEGHSKMTKLGKMRLGKFEED